MADYTKPKLRRRLKDKIQAAGKGGKKGQWSARKSQLLVQSYEKAGGGYKGKRDARQKSLQKWGDEKWQTKDGKAGARTKNGTKRYLPEAAWALLTKAEREATEKRKKGSKNQFEANTKAAKEARKALKLVERKAGPARDRIARADDRSLLKRVRKAERQGRSRKTVLAAIDKRRKSL